MQISGVQKLTLVDYPGKVASIVFTLGCNFRCQYCYNAEFVLPEKIQNLKALIGEHNFLKFLDTRVGLLDGVVVCGGEPTIHDDLPRFCQEIKDRGFLVKLDTQGSNPDMIQDLIDQGLIDYVAMDVKHTI